MRSTDERILAVKVRTRELQRRSSKRRGIVFPTIATTACVAAIVGLAFLIPSALSDAPAPSSGTSGAFGSIIASGGGLGYVVIGLLAFCLGAAVTLLCVKVLEYSRENSRRDFDAPDADKDARQ